MTVQKGGWDYFDEGWTTSTESTPLTLAGGVHTYTAIKGGQRFRIVSDVDVFVRSSTVSALYGLHLDYDADMFRTGETDMTALTEMQGLLATATDDAAFEFWIQNDSTTATGNLNRVFGISKVGASSVDFYIYPNAGEYLVSYVLNDATGTIVFSDVANTTSVTADTEMHHVVFNIDRTNDKLQTYIDGVLVHENASAGGTAGVVDFADTVTWLYMGGTVNGNGEWDGLIYDAKVYKDVLSAAEVIARNSRGPVQSAADLYRDTPVSKDPVIWYNFADSALWADAAEPEPVIGYGTIPELTLDSATGTPTIQLAAGGVAATPSVAAPIIAGTPEIITTVSSDAYLNVYTKPGVTGTVWITEL